MLTLIMRPADILPNEPFGCNSEDCYREVGGVSTAVCATPFAETRCCCAEVCW